MPKRSVPVQYRDILESTTLGHLATVDGLGRPGVNPVWFLWDGEHVLISVKAETKKYRNPRRDLLRYVEPWGEVVDFALSLTLDFVNQLAHKYTGDDFQGGHAGERRYKLTIQVNSWTAQG
jgi:hypothetical protein